MVYKLRDENMLKLKKADYVKPETKETEQIRQAETICLLITQ